ncbi:MAG TPA: DUF3375 family protein, partial [Propionibacteriaceae bacterium]
LAEVVAEQPLQQGLAELVGYLSLLDSAFEVVVDEEHRDQLSWEGEECLRVADLPLVTFARQPSGPAGSRVADGLDSTAAGTGTAGTGRPGTGTNATTRD